MKFVPRVIIFAHGSALILLCIQSLYSRGIIACTKSPENVVVACRKEVSIYLSRYKDSTDLVVRELSGSMSNEWISIEKLENLKRY